MSMDKFPTNTSPTNPSEKQLLLGSGETSVNTKSNEQGANVVATFFNFAKASIGSGSFALPFAVLSAGVIIGSLGMILLGVVSLYTMQLMLQCRDEVFLNLTSEEKKSFNYTELGKKAFEKIRIEGKNLGPIGKWAVDLSVLACNLGVCAGYMIFIASNLRWAFICFAYHHETETGTCFTSWELYAIVLPILIVLTYLPTFKYLAYAAYVGAFFLIVAMITVIYYGIRDGFNYSPVQWGPNNWEGIAQWFGLTAFLFCVHSMVIPLQNSMKKPQYMTYVLDAAALVVVGINLPFALYGYFMFGKDTQGYIFENIPGGVFNDIVRVCLSIELTLTFPIVFKPASDVMEEIIQGVLLYIARTKGITKILELYGRREMKWKVIHTVMVCVVRTLLVLISWGVAIGIPRFELCLAFVGSLAASVLAFVLPPLFHPLLLWKKTSIYRNILHIFILVVGIIATILATGINLYEAIKDHSSGNDCPSIQNGCVSTGASNQSNDTSYF